MQHKDIPDDQRHEPKGAATATVDQVYASDGAGSGEWREIPYSDTVVLADVSTASSVFMPIPIDVEIQSIRFVLSAAITVANSLITVTRGGDAASLGVATIPFTASAEGTTIDLVPTGNATLASATNTYLKFTTDGGSTTTVPIYISIKAKVI